MELIWSDEDQLFRTIPDGDIASHKQIKEAVMDSFIHKCEIRKIIREISIDVERNERRKVEHTIDHNSESWSMTKISYDPELVKLRLENMLRR